MKRINLICLLSIFSSFLFLHTMTHAAEALSDVKEEAWFYTQSSESLKSMTPESALQRLKEGNERFVSGKMKTRNLLQQAKLTSKKGQYPFAVILSCMDSRGSPELIFDQGIGDIFSIRVAGNVIDEDQLGSMEYAAKAVGTHIIVVMGHTLCGAVKGACSGVVLGNLTQLLHKIDVAKKTVKENKQVSKMDCNNDEIINDIAKQNVLDMMQQIKENSPIISQLVNEKQVAIIGAMHDLKSGQVDFFNE